MARETILLVEDEVEIQELLRYNLAKEGYQPLVAGSGEEAFRLLREHVVDLILLDLMLPGIDGLTVCRRLKADPDTQSAPVIMLTAKGEEADIVAGLELGADDYVPKPFSLRVLIARIRSVLRRVHSEPTDGEGPLSVHDIVIHPGRHEVTVAGKPVALTPTEFRVLHFLARRPGWVFTRSQIADAVHGEENVVTDRSVDVQIVGLRRKLGEAGKYVETVRGVGYRFRE
ncbi:response regulator transcription factor [Thermostilla marina]